MQIERKTKIGKNGGNGNTLKSTIPKIIVDVLELQEGDYLNWNLEIKNNNVQLSIEKEPKNEK